MPWEDIRVLVVDDNRDAADTVGMLLELDGYAVRVMYDPREAVSSSPEFKPHMAILDIGMPHMSGYELASRLRAGDFPPDTVVALSGWGTDSDKEEAARCGFDRHFTKPANPAELLAYMRERCERLAGH